MVEILDGEGGAVVEHFDIGDCLCFSCVSISRSHLESCLWITPMGWVSQSIAFFFFIFMKRVFLAWEISNQINVQRNTAFNNWQVYQDWLRSEFVQTTLCRPVSSGSDPDLAGGPPLKLFTPSSSLILASRPLRWKTLESKDGYNVKLREPSTSTGWWQIYLGSTWEQVLRWWSTYRPSRWLFSTLL